MPISFQCPECAKPFNLGDEMAGKKARCGCGAVIRVPQSAAPAQQPAPPSPAQQPLVPQQPVDPLMGSLPPVEQSPAPQQLSYPVTGVQQPSAVAGAGGKGGKMVIMVGAGVGGVAALGLVIWLVVSMLPIGPDTHFKVFDDWFAATEELADALNDIETVDDVKEFKIEIERLNAKMLAINERARALEKPDRELQQQLRFRLGDSTKDAMTSIMLKSAELGKDPELKAALEEAMSEVIPMEAPEDWFE
jgi:hypothetical protein